MDPISATASIIAIGKYAVQDVWPRVCEELGLDERAAARRTGDRFEKNVGGVTQGLTAWAKEGDLSYWASQVLAGKSPSEERMAKSMLKFVTLGPRPDSQELARKILRDLFRELKGQALRSKNGRPTLNRLVLCQV